MNKIMYNGSSILEAKTSVELYNNNILEALKNIEKELDNINQVVNTPKINQAKELFSDFYKEKISYVEQKKNYYNKIFDTINHDYQDYLTSINKMVGEEND